MQDYIYEYQPRAGYNGTGAWVVYGSKDCYGHRNRVDFCSTESEARKLCESLRGKSGHSV